MTLLEVFKEAMCAGFVTTKFTLNDTLFDELTDIWEEILLLRVPTFPNSKKSINTPCHGGYHYCEELDAHFQIFVQRFDTYYSLECKWVILPGKYKWEDAITKIDVSQSIH